MSYDYSPNNPLYPQMGRVVPGTEDFQHVAAFSDGGGYDWTDWACWYSPSRRRYFVISGSGCSCDSLDSDLSGLDDFEALASKEAVKQSLLSFIEGRYEYRKPTKRPNVNEQISDINAFRRAS